MFPDKNLQMVRGNAFPFDVEITLNGEPVNLTNCTLTFTAKFAYTDADASAVFKLTSTPATGITILSAVNGTANITIPATATSALTYNDINLVYDLRLVDASSIPFVVMRGNLFVEPNVTRS